MATLWQLQATLSRLRQASQGRTYPRPCIRQRVRIASYSENSNILVPGKPNQPHRYQCCQPCEPSKPLLFSNNVFKPCTCMATGIPSTITNRPHHSSTSWHEALHPSRCSDDTPSITPIATPTAVVGSQTMRSLLFTSPGTCRRREAR